MRSKFLHWLKHIRETEDEEINCSDCLDQISQYVDLELSTGQAALAMPQVSQHLGQCQVCLEEYQILRDLARLELDEKPPTNLELIDLLQQHSK